VLLVAIAAPLIEETLFSRDFLRGFVPRYGTFGVLSAQCFSVRSISIRRSFPAPL
jgi:hypothetical protein